MAKPKLFPTKATKPAEPSASSLLCQYNDHGVTCPHVGVLSPSTLGTGPWYCRDHAWVFLHDRSSPKPEAREQWNAVKSLLPGHMRKDFE